MIRATTGALESLQRAAASHEPTLVIIASDWAFDRLRAHPRFHEILKTLGLASVR